MNRPICFGTKFGDRGDLPAEATTGAPAAEALGLDDPAIEIKVTPNRPDCLGVHGIARDLAAAGLGKLKSAAVQPVKGAGPCPISVTLAFEAGDEHLCPAFALRLVRGQLTVAVVGFGLDARRHDVIRDARPRADAGG